MVRRVCQCLYVFSVVRRGDAQASRVDNLVVWNHDDVPLKSDVVPQAVALARVQNYLGGLSGLEY